MLFVQKKHIITLHLLCSLLLSLLGSLFLATSLLAAPIYNSQNILSTILSDVPANHSITFFTPSGVAAAETISITFPSAFDLSSIVLTDINMSVNDSAFTLAATANAATWGVNINSTTNVITFTSDTGTISQEAKVEFLIGTHTSNGANQIVNPDTPGNYDIVIGGTFADSGVITVVISDDSQVSINAQVENIITFSMSETNINFGQITSSAARWANASNGSSSLTPAHAITISTNASLGYSITMYGPTLTSGANTIAAIGSTPQTSNPGTEQFGVFASINDNPSNNATIASMFSTANNYAFVPNDITLIFSADSPSGETVYDIAYIVNISPLTPAGSYSSNIGYIATANF